MDRYVLSDLKDDLTCKLFCVFCVCFTVENCLNHDCIVLTKRFFHTSAKYDTLSALFFYHYSFVFIPPLLALIVVFQALQRHKAAISSTSTYSVKKFSDRTL